MFFLLDNECNEEDKQSVMDLFKDCPSITPYTPTSPKVSFELPEEQLDSECNDTPDSTDPSKLEKRRKRGKLRSKKSRDRKKLYQDELECRVKDLEKENMRLRYLIDQHKRQNYQLFDRDTNELIKDQDVVEREIKKSFVDELTNSVKKDTENEMINFFDSNFKMATDIHLRLLDKGFEMVVDHVAPFIQRAYWKDVDTDYELDFDVITKLSKLSKYQEAEFFKEHKITEGMRLIAKMKPTKKQFKYFKDVQIPKDRYLKRRMDKIVETLINTRNELSSVLSDLH